MFYVVLSDNSTYDSDGFVAVLTPRGEEQLAEDLDYKHVDVREIIEQVSIADLWDAYNQVRGTQE
jgi:hypothetical protein